MLRTKTKHASNNLALRQSLINGLNNAFFARTLNCCLLTPCEKKFDQDFTISKTNLTFSGGFPEEDEVSSNVELQRQVINTYSILYTNDFLH